MVKSAVPTIAFRRASATPQPTHSVVAPPEEDADDYFGMASGYPLTPYVTANAGSASPISHLALTSRRVSPWAGAARSPGLQVAPAAIDYFNETTASKQSWRALQNLGLVAVGRTLLTLGLAGVLEGFQPGPLGATPGATPGAVMPGPPLPTRIYHPAVFGLGMAGAIVGLSMHTAGLARFYNDTARLNARRAKLILTIGTLGALLVTAGGAYYLYGVIHKRPTITWEALPMRSLGNFCVYGAIPNSFSASEIVHGDTPLKNRIFWRDVLFASGGMFLMTWAQISLPTPPAPLWARELAQCMGIICIAVGGALPRVDGMRAQAQMRAAANV